VTWLRQLFLRPRPLWPEDCYRLIEDHLEGLLPARDEPLQVAWSDVVRIALAAPSAPQQHPQVPMATRSKLDSRS
jgi:hypothetical protein